MPSPVPAIIEARSSPAGLAESSSLGCARIQARLFALTSRWMNRAQRHSRRAAGGDHGMRLR
jgi:hypothetical protein